MIPSAGGKGEFRAPALKPSLSDPGSAEKPLVSIVIPALNESAVVVESLRLLCGYMDGLEAEYRWELLFVDDGSTDGTGDLARAALAGRGNVRVLTHQSNLGMGEGLRSAFRWTRGDYVVTLDLDLSYSVDHIGALLARIVKSGAQVVVASPYARGGRVSNVPWLRHFLSRWANRFLAATTKEAPITLTGIVRAYDGPFLRALNLRSRGMEINPEIIYKSLVMRAHIEEVPAHLDWSRFRSRGRTSSMRVLKHISSVLVSGYLFKPFIFFMLPGIACLVSALVSWGYLVVRYAARAVPESGGPPGILGYLRAGFDSAYEHGPYIFLIAIAMFLMGVQFLGFGFLALQGKRNFEELFSLGTRINQSLRDESEHGNE